MAPQNSGSAIEQFLTPEAMLTPGVLGSLTMMITNVLVQNFAMPKAWLGLGLSFIFGLLVLVTARNVIIKGVFYLLNSLVIFCMAAGANGLGAGSGATRVFVPDNPGLRARGLCHRYAESADSGILLELVCGDRSGSEGQSAA